MGGEFAAHTWFPFLPLANISMGDQGGLSGHTPSLNC